MLQMEGRICSLPYYYYARLFVGESFGLFTFIVRERDGLLKQSMAKVKRCRFFFWSINDAVLSTINNHVLQTFKLQN